MVQPDAPQCMKVNLWLSARNIIEGDWLSASDTKCHVFLRTDDGRWDRIGKTETIDNEPNPNWTKCVTVDYYFEKRQELKFVIKDDDDNTSDDELGSTCLWLGDIVAWKTEGNDNNHFWSKFETRAKGAVAQSMLIVRAEAVRDTAEVARIAFRI